jgi:hypothetical protein
MAAGNTYNPCLVILHRRGYRLSVDDGGGDGGSPVYSAAKDGARFSAHTPPELLGIVVLGEELGHDWNLQQPDMLGTLLREEPGE